MAKSINDLTLVAQDDPVAAGSPCAARRLYPGLLIGFDNAFRPAIGDMAAVVHERPAANWVVMTAAEAMRVGAIEHDLPGMVPAGKFGGVVRDDKGFGRVGRWPWRR